VTAPAELRCLCSEARQSWFSGCGDLLPDGSEAPEQEATPAILACPICGDEAPRCRYHWEEHVEDHTLLGARLVASNHGWYALDRGDGWYDSAVDWQAEKMRPKAYLTILADDYDGDESRIPAALRPRLVQLAGLRAAIEDALCTTEADVEDASMFGKLAPFIRSRQLVLASLTADTLDAIDTLSRAARVGKDAWEAECKRADAANACLHRRVTREIDGELQWSSRGRMCPDCGWSRHQTACYTDRCPWCGSIEPPCPRCAAGDT